MPEARVGLSVAAPLAGRATGLLECLRPQQWIKNGFVFAPLVFSASLRNSSLALSEFFAFASFCLVASGIYAWNDALDWRADLNHPEKRNRPIPSGRLSVPLAISAAILLVASGLAVGFQINAQTGGLVACYVLLNTLYSLKLKHISILDLMCIAVGFMLRILAGAAAIHVTPSHWLLLCGFLLALLLAAAKRRHEVDTLAENGELHRKALAEYSIGWLDQAVTMLSAATSVAYALYTVAPETQDRFHTDGLIYTVPFVVYGLLRYLKLSHSSEGTGNPTAALMLDPHLLLCVVGWAAVCGAVIYL
jgi:4-hydroxybenzoate polyprenyltransferase